MKKETLRIKSMNGTSAKEKRIIKWKETEKQNNKNKEMLCNRKQKRSWLFYQIFTILTY